MCVANGIYGMAFNLRRRTPVAEIVEDLRLSILGDWDAGCVMTRDRQYRYALWRKWRYTGVLRRVCWIMLNPSNADHETDDATLRRCVRFSKEWGFGGLEVVNLFAVRSSSPAILQLTTDPVGPENNKFLMERVEACDLVVVAWGALGSVAGRDAEVLKMLEGKRLACLGLTANGMPKHPVRLSAATNLRGFPYGEIIDVHSITAGAS